MGTDRCRISVLCLMSSNRLIFLSKHEPLLPNMTTEQYIEFSEVSTIMAEATKLFLRKAQSVPSNVLAEFCQQYVKGEHVLLKAFNNFSKSSFNRLCFVCNFNKVFEIDEETTQRSGFDYLQLIRLICSDFPREILVTALKLCSGDYDLPEEAAFEKLLSGRQFVKGLFLSCMYTDLIKEIQKFGTIKLEQALRLLREMHARRKMQFEMPSYRVLIDVALSLSRYVSKEVVFVTDAIVGNYITTESVTGSKVLNQLYSSELNDREVEERLEFLDVLSLRVNEIGKILSDKEDTGTVAYKAPKKKKK